MAENEVAKINWRHELQICSDAKNLELVLQNGLGTELKFTQVTEISENKKYYEVTKANVNKAVGHLGQGALPIAQQAVSAAQLAKMAPNGLFTSTANVGTLMQYGDGSFGSMIMNNGSIAKHSGFVQVGTQAINPIVPVAIGMQAAAMVSGQYYLDRINGELNAITCAQLDEKLSVLENARERLLKITDRQYVDQTDLMEIRNLQGEIHKVYLEYKRRLDREYEAATQHSLNISTGSQRDKFENKLETLSNTIQICYLADRLYIQSELAEICARVKMGDKEPKLYELMKQIQNEYDESFSLKLESGDEDFWNPLIDEANKVYEGGLKIAIAKSAKEKYLSPMLEKINQVKSNYEKDLPGACEEFKEACDTDYEMVLVPGSFFHKQRVFIAVDEDK